MTSAPVPPSSVSLPPPPMRRSLPLPPSNVSSPSPGKNGPPSEPLSPCRMSAPLPPIRWSSPHPPHRTSFPPPPSRVSLPLSARTKSSKSNQPAQVSSRSVRVCTSLAVGIAVPIAAPAATPCGRHPWEDHAEGGQAPLFPTEQQTRGCSRRNTRWTCPGGTSGLRAQPLSKLLRHRIVRALGGKFFQQRGGAVAVGCAQAKGLQIVFAPLRRGVRRPRFEHGERLLLAAAHHDGAERSQQRGIAAGGRRRADAD